MPLSSMLKIFLGVSERLVSVATLSSILQNIPTVFRFILQTLAKDRLSAVISCTFSFIIEIIWNSHIISLVSQSAVARTVCVRLNLFPRVSEYAWRLLWFYRNF
jgi:hypothetical protein